MIRNGDAQVMDKNVKTLWLEALRSGKYRQGHGALAIPGPNGDEYCCLGVLCDVALWADLQVTVGTAYQDNVKVHAFDGGTATLPHSVRTWAGLESHNPETKETGAGTGGRGYTLAELNDSAGYTFEQLADVIERDL